MLRKAILVSVIFAIGCPIANNASAEPSNCTAVNQIYDATRNSSRYQVVTYSIAPGETERKFQYEQRWNGIDLFQRFEGGYWKKNYREPRSSLNDDGEPVFSNCTRLPDRTINGKKLQTFEAAWHREPNRATIIIQVLDESGAMIETVREFQAARSDSGSGIKAGKKVIEEFTYDRNVPNPPGF